MSYVIIILEIFGGIMKRLLIILFLLLGINYNTKYTYVDKEINIFKELKKEVKQEEKKDKVIKTYYGNITAYGPDCKGCSGITASGYNVKNTIYYHDKKYGKVRIVAADKSIPFGTIVRIKNLTGFSSPVIAIVLDRGSAIGFNRRAYFDLLYKSERDSLSFGIQKTTFEILRNGY